MSKTIRQSFRIDDYDTLSECYGSLAKTYSEHHEDKSTIISVSIDVMDKDKARTVAQNSLYWMWVTRIANKLGNNKAEQHDELKRNHLAKIYVRDNPEFAEMSLALRKYREVATQAEYEPLAKGVAHLMSTTKATVTQMTEFLKDIDRYYYAQGLVLPRPSDYDWIIGESENHAK